MKIAATFGEWLALQASQKNLVGDLAIDFLRDCRARGEDPATFVYPHSLFGSDVFLMHASEEAKRAAKIADEEYSVFRETHPVKKPWLTLNGKIAKKSKLVARFGVWEFCPKWLTLTNIECPYEIDLERINSTAEMLDWIFQLSHKGKSVYGETVVEDLIKAFDAIFAPQANCCSFGVEKKFRGRGLAKQYAAKLSHQ